MFSVECDLRLNEFRVSIIIVLQKICSCVHLLFTILVKYVPIMCNILSNIPW